jgi:hypothetical protein
VKRLVTTGKKEGGNHGLSYLFSGNSGFPLCRCEIFHPSSKNRAKPGLKERFFSKKFFLLFPAGGFGLPPGVEWVMTPGKPG